jgi:hypothetical protein
MNNPYVEETLIREYMADLQRGAARRHMLHALEPVPRVAGPPWIVRVVRALWRPRPARVERLVPR